MHTYLEPKLTLLFCSSFLPYVETWRRSLPFWPPKNYPPPDARKCHPQEPLPCSGKRWELNPLTLERWNGRLLGSCWGFVGFPWWEEGKGFVAGGGWLGGFVWLDGGRFGSSNVFVCFFWGGKRSNGVNRNTPWWNSLSRFLSWCWCDLGLMLAGLWGRIFFIGWTESWLVSNRNPLPIWIIGPTSNSHPIFFLKTSSGDEHHYSRRDLLIPKHWRSLNHLKDHLLNQRKKGTSRIARTMRDFLLSFIGMADV